MVALTGNAGNVDIEDEANRLYLLSWADQRHMAALYTAMVHIVANTTDPEACLAAFADDVRCMTVRAQGGGRA